MTFPLPVFLPTFPPAPLPPPTSGVPVTLTWVALTMGSTGASVPPVSVIIYRLRVRQVSSPIRRPGQTGLVNLDGSPFPTTTRILAEKGETVALLNGQPYATFVDDLRGYSEAGGRPWAWFTLDPSIAPPAGGVTIRWGGQLNADGTPLRAGAGLQP